MRARSAVGVPRARARRAPTSRRASSSAPVGPVMCSLVTTSGPSSATSRASSVPAEQPQLGRPGRRLGGDAQLAVAQRSRRAVGRDVGADQPGPVGEHPGLGQRPVPAAVLDVAGEHRARAAADRGPGPGPAPDSHRLRAGQVARPGAPARVPVALRRPVRAAARSAAARLARSASAAPGEIDRRSRFPHRLPPASWVSSVSIVRSRGVRRPQHRRVFHRSPVDNGVTDDSRFVASDVGQTIIGHGVTVPAVTLEPGARCSWSGTSRGDRRGDERLLGLAGRPGPAARAARRPVRRTRRRARAPDHRPAARRRAAARSCPAAAPAPPTSPRRGSRTRAPAARRCRARGRRGAGRPG